MWRSGPDRRFTAEPADVHGLAVPVHRPGFPGDRGQFDACSVRGRLGRSATAGEMVRSDPGMTAGNNGASKPEDDDPFGYLYADGQAAGAQPPGQGGYGYPGPAAQPGVPRTSYNQVRTVGERQYGQQVPQQQAYGYPPQAPQGGPNGAYGRPNPQYA